MQILCTLLGISAFLTATVQADRIDDCADGPYQSGTDQNGNSAIHSIGGGTGSPFCETKWKQGLVIKGIEVWADSNCVRAVQFKYSDDSLGNMIGKADGNINKRIMWDPISTRVEKLELWGDGKGKRLGRIKIRLSNNEEFDAGKDTLGQTTYNMVVGAGIMLGAYGGSGTDVDMLGILFLGSKVESLKITDLKLDADSKTLNEQKT